MYMRVSMKCQYALRGLFALARREQEGLSRVTDVAAEQGIPPRYLENIFNQLRQGGFVESRRGKEGGFYLTRPARDIRVGEIIKFIEGPMHPTGCTDDSPGKDVCQFKGCCAFIRLWDEAEKALESVYNATTLQDLVDEDRRLGNNAAIEYCI